MALNASELPKLDAEFEEITEGEELTKKEKLNTKWAALEALVGDPKRIALIAADLVTHLTSSPTAQSGCAQRYALSVSLSPLAEFGSRSGWRPMDGKAMIVCMGRRICVAVFDALIKLRPEWDAETLKVVMTDSAEDKLDWHRQKFSARKEHPHLRTCSP